MWVNHKIGTYNKVFLRRVLDKKMRDITRHRYNITWTIMLNRWALLESLWLYDIEVPRDVEDLPDCRAIVEG